MLALTRRSSTGIALTVVTLALATLAARHAVADGDALALPDADLKTLCDKQLKEAVAAVSSSGPATFALDDEDVISEGPHVTAPPVVAAALRASAEAAKVKLVKHADDLNVPMLRVHVGTLVRVNAAETVVNHELYLEVEAPTRELLHVQLVDSVRQGPGGATSGKATPQNLDAIAEKCLRSWVGEKRPDSVTVLGNPKQPRPLAQQALANRIAVRLLHKVRLVAASRGSGPDVARPPKAVLLSPACVLFVTYKENVSQMAILVEGMDPVKSRTVFLFRDPEQVVDNKTPRPVQMVKSNAEGLLFKLNGNYLNKPGQRAKIWLCEADIDKDLMTPELKQQMTTMLRSTLLARELKDYSFEAHDGELKNADAKASDVFFTVAPRFYMENGHKMCGIQVRLVSEDRVYEDDVSLLVERRKAP